MQLYITKFILLIILFTFLVSCKSKDEANPSETVSKESNTIALSDAQLKNTPIETGKLTKREFIKTIETTGNTIVPPDGKVSVSLPYGGYIKQINLVQGKYTAKGQILATIENAQFINLQEEFLTNSSKLDYNNLELARQVELNKDKSSSDKLLQQARHENQMLTIAKKALSEKLSLLGINTDKLTASNMTKSINIYAPASGYISAVNANRGQYINPENVLCEIIDVSNQLLSLKIFEKDLPFVSVGQSVEAFQNSNPQKIYNCKVKLINKNTSENYTEVLCTFSDKNINPGSYFNAKINSKSNKFYACPEAALVDFEGKKYIFVETNKSQYDMIAVTSNQKGEGYLVIDNFDALIDKNIVVKGAYTLLMKKKNTME